MDITLGMHVYSSDDREIGTVDKLILDPEKDTVKAVVVRKGTFLHQDVEVPTDKLTARADNNANIAYTASEIDTLPQFDERIYTAPPADYVSPMDYPRTALYWPAGYLAGAVPMDPAAAGTATTSAWPTPEATMWPRDSAVSRELGEALRRNDIENALIGEGSEVLGRDGGKVGKIRELTFDPNSSQLTRLVVHKGILFGKDVEVPAALIDSVDDGIVYLSVDAKEAVS